MDCKHKVLGAITKSLNDFDKQTCIQILDHIADQIGH